MRDFTHPTFMDKGTANPFADDVYVDHPDNLPGVARVHHSTFNRIVGSVEALVVHPDRNTPADSLGRTILVTAPRAGYGKSHLAARLRHHLRSAATTLILPLDSSRPVAWPVALSSVLRQFSNESGVRSGNHSLFEETGRYLLAQVILSHLISGNLRAKDCPTSEDSLRSDFADLFSSDSSARMLNWLDKRSRELCREADPEFLRRIGFTENELGHWLRLLIDQNLRGDSALDSLRGLSNGEARERLLQWLRIATFYRPALIVADGLDGFFRSETAGMEIASLLTGIRDSVPRSITLISVNDDVWESVFETRLPSAWIDRITGETETLRSLTPEAAGDLVRFRLKRISIGEGGANRFVERLSSDHLWVDAETTLSPRIVIRQARELWETDGASFLTERFDGDDTMEREIAKKPLSKLTDKVEFFTALQNDQDETSPPPPRETSVKKDGPPPLPATNPFFAPPESIDSRHLAGIDSVIADIRGSGKKVVSEGPTSEEPPQPAQENNPVPEPRRSFQAGALHLKPTKTGDRKTNGNDKTTPISPAREGNPISIETALREEEKRFLDRAPLKVDLERIGHFIRTVGAQHPGLNQSEEHFPSSRTACLRWQVHGQSVLLGFESPRNVYFWNNLLQQSLASSEKEKIAAFSHSTDGFDAKLFSSFGFSPAVIQDHIDVIELRDRELSMVYAAEEILRQFADTPDAGRAVQIVTRYLDPLWRRVSRPV